MFKKKSFGFLVPFCIAFFILSPLKPGIFPKSIDKTTNWPEPVFEHLTIAEGLPENSVRCILQDHLGYMWFGTQNGLVKYDGYNMKVFQPDPDDSLSISDRQIFVIYEDRSGTLWIGTEHEGLNRFNRATETFTRYRLNPDDSIGEYSIGGILEDISGNLLLGNGQKLIIFNPQDKSSEDIYTQDSIIARDVRALIEDSLTGKIFVAVKNKIMIYDPENKVLIKNNKLSETLKLGTINSLYQAIDGTIWIGHSKGIARFNSAHNTIKYYQPIQSKLYTEDNDIGKLIEDKNGFIWGCGYQDRNNLGLVCFESETEQFKIYKFDPEDKSSLSTNIVWSICKDHSDVLWVGTGWGGLNKWDRSKNKFKRFSYDSNGERFNLVSSAIEDKQGIIWFGTDNGLYSFNRQSNEFRNYKYNAKSKDNYIGDIYLDDAGIIWFTTTTRGFGRFDREKGSFYFYSNNQNDSISFKESCFLSLDRYVGLWLIQA